MAYPATLEFDPPEHVARWRPLVAWLLAIPHFIVLAVLGFVSWVVAVISWFAILFTGKMPPGLAGLQILYLRYYVRANMYSGFLFGEYPPFDFSTTSDDPGGLPVTIDVAPALEGRNRLTVGLRFIWIIPAALFLMVIWFAALVVWFIAFFAVIILGRWPDGMRDFVVKANRLTVQVNSYGLLLNDDYPPFGLTPDGQSGTEGPAPMPPPGAPAAPDAPAGDA